MSENRIDVLYVCLSHNYRNIDVFGLGRRWLDLRSSALGTVGRPCWVVSQLLMLGDWGSRCWRCGDLEACEEVSVVYVLLNRL